VIPTLICVPATSPRALLCAVHIRLGHAFLAHRGNRRRWGLANGTGRGLIVIGAGGTKAAADTHHCQGVYCVPVNGIFLNKYFDIISQFWKSFKNGIRNSCILFT
jgi:hypothetical protein